MKKLAMMLSIIWLCGALEDSQAQPRLILRLERDSLLESQAVWVHVALVNSTLTKQTVQHYVLSDDMSRGVRITLIDERAASVPQGVEGIHDDFGTAEPRILAPGDSITRMFNILGWFSTSGIRNAPPYLPTLHYLRSGTYTLRATQFTGNDTLHSNVVRFIVVKPKGREHQALQSLVNADQKYAEDARSNATVLAYERFVSSYRQSVYAPYAYYRLIFVHYSLRPKQNNQKVFELIKKLAEAFPNDPQAVYVVSTYAAIIVRDGKSEILEELSRNLSEAKVGELSRRKLRELQQR